MIRMMKQSQEQEETPKLKYKYNYKNNTKAKYRTRYEIIKTILDCIDENTTSKPVYEHPNENNNQNQSAAVIKTGIKGASKTRIMYASYLSYDQLKEYLVIAQNHDLIKQLNPIEFILTEKGKQYLKLVNQLFELVPPTK